MPASRSRARFRTAVLLLALLSAALTAVLVSCPRSRSPADTSAAPPVQTAPEPEPQPEPEPRDQPVVQPEPSKPAAVGRLAVVIDDAGYDLEALQPFLDLPMPLAVAVLPNLPHSGEAARRVLAAGKELLLHLPMEPEGGENPGPGALLTGQPAVETRAAARRGARLGARRASA